MKDILYHKENIQKRTDLFSTGNWQKSDGSSWNGFGYWTEYFADAYALATRNSRSHHTPLDLSTSHH